MARLPQRLHVLIPLVIFAGRAVTSSMTLSVTKLTLSQCVFGLRFSFLKLEAAEPGAEAEAEEVKRLGELEDEDVADAPKLEAAEPGAEELEDEDVADAPKRAKSTCPA